MCDKCNPDKLNLLIESEKIANMIYLSIGQVLKRESIDEQDNSLVLEIRNDIGYLRLGDRGDMQCLDHDCVLQINYCPMCGRKI